MGGGEGGEGKGGGGVNLHFRVNSRRFCLFAVFHINEKMIIVVSLGQWGCVKSLCFLVYGGCFMIFAPSAIVLHPVGLAGRKGPVSNQPSGHHHNPVLRGVFALCI